MSAMQFPTPAPARPPLSDKYIAAMKYRIELFIRRGMSEACAEAWACRLASRDMDRDDRRICFECSNYRRDGSCSERAPKKKNHQPGDWQKFLQPLPFVLQRCGSFRIQKP